MYRLVRPALFKLDPEVAHHLSLRGMQLVGLHPALRAAVRLLLRVPSGRPINAFGLRFPNAVGMAAGYDKDGTAWRGLTSLGFGHVEVGTVTPRPQPGNPKPRVFRLPEDQSLINRLGFPSAGASALAPRLGDDRPGASVLGVNIGKNKDTPLEEAVHDYAGLIRRFASRADYLVVNVSSPNTPNLRRLQHKQALGELLSELVGVRNEESDRLGRPVPLLVKLAPDLSDDQLDDALDAILGWGLDGVIATNTTISREGLRSAAASERGGLSGRALTDKSTAMIRAIYERTSGELPIVGVGGIMSADDAKAKLDAGASLVQIYTGLVYNGPAFVGDLIRATR